MCFAIIQCFDAIFGRQKEYLVCKSSARTVSKSLLLGTGLTWSSSGGMGQLNRNWVYVCVYI